MEGIRVAARVRETDLTGRVIIERGLKVVVKIWVEGGWSGARWR